MRGVLIGISMLLTCSGFAQLPSEMYYSADGKVLHTGGQGQTGLYELLSLKNVYLDFPQSNYWTLLTNNYDSETLIPATMTYDNMTLDSVGVRFRGNTSYSTITNSDKKSFKIETDFVDDDQELLGYSGLKFNNGHQDATFMREVLYSNMASKYTPIAKANYIHLYLNNQDWGIYPNVQAIDKTFLSEWFLSNDGARFRATTDNTTTGGGGGPGGGGGGGGSQWGDGTAALNYLGSDTALYQDYYTLKSSDISDSWEKLVDACEIIDNATVNNMPTTLAKIDIDKALWFLASENIFTDDDSYIMKGKMDYMVYYEPETGRTTPIEYDGNSSFVINDATSSAWDPFKNVTDANYPLLYKTLSIPEWRQRYLAHYRTILNETFTTANATVIIHQLDSLIADEVASDTKKLESTADYISGVPALITFVTDRRNFLLSNSEVAQMSPTIVDAKFYNSSMDEYTVPLPNEVGHILSEVTSATGVNGVHLYYATGVVGNFTKTDMYDDGMHNDGAASDGVYGATIPGYSAGTMVRYYVEAIANNAFLSASYLPVGAEHDIFVYTVTTELASNGVVINELMASNDTTAVDEAGDYDDWVELYNTNSYSVDLSGFYITDDTSSLTEWEIPAGTVIDAYAYLIIWCDDDETDGTYHSTIKLSASGESVSLVNDTLGIVDQVFFSAQTTDMGYARLPNGTGPFVIQNPTFNASNDLALGDASLATDYEFKVYPNPASNVLHIDFSNLNPSESIQIYSMVGALVFESMTEAALQIDISNYQTGMYVVKYGPHFEKIIIQ